MKITLTACLIVSVLASCSTDRTGGFSTVPPPQIFTIKAPVAGNYPQGLYKYPYRAGSQTNELFTQTLEWSPQVSKTFDTNTQYTATLTLVPVNMRQSFKGTTLDDVKGLPTDGVENISMKVKNRDLIIKIAFETTTSENADAQILFSDEFEGESLDITKWNLCPEWDRQGRSSWRDNMVSINGGLLHLKFMRDTGLGKTKSSKKSLADNWIRSGAIRTQTKNGRTLFENAYGYYEAKIKFPVVRGTWGAFWLMSTTQWITTDEGKDGTEIDIVESINNNRGRYNAAMHWNGYSDKLKSVSSGDIALPVNIYDGEFHIFALDWSPSEYVFYVDGKIFWRSDGSAQFKNSGINQNPNYIKLSVEGAEWAGNLPEDFTEAEMLVDYVRVYNQPRCE